MLHNMGGVQMLGFKLFSRELTLYLNTAGTLSKVFKDEYKSDISYLKSSRTFDVPRALLAAILCWLVTP